MERLLAMGPENAAARRAMAQLGVSDRLTAEARSVASQSFGEVDALMDKVVGQAFGGPVIFANAIITALAEPTIQFVAASSSQRKALTRIGFGALLRASGTT